MNVIVSRNINLDVGDSQVDDSDRKVRSLRTHPRLTAKAMDQHGWELLTRKNSRKLHSPTQRPLNDEVERPVKKRKVSGQEVDSTMYPDETSTTMMDIDTGTQDSKQDEVKDDKNSLEKIKHLEDGLIPSPTNHHIPSSPRTQTKSEEKRLKEWLVSTMHDYPEYGDAREWAIWLAWKLDDARRYREDKIASPQQSPKHMRNHESPVSTFKKEEGTGGLTHGGKKKKHTEKVCDIRSHQRSSRRIMPSRPLEVSIDAERFPLFSSSFVDCLLVEKQENMELLPIQWSVVCNVLAALGSQYTSRKAQKNADTLLSYFEHDNHIRPLAEAIEQLSENPVVQVGVNELLQILEEPTLYKQREEDKTSTQEHSINEKPISSEKRAKRRRRTLDVSADSEVPSPKPNSAKPIPPGENPKPKRILTLYLRSKPESPVKPVASNHTPEPRKIAKRTSRRSLNRRSTPSRSGRKGSTTEQAAFMASQDETVVGEEPPASSQQTLIDSIYVTPRVNRASPPAEVPSEHSVVTNPSPVDVPSSITSFESTAGSAPAKDKDILGLEPSAVNHREWMNDVFANFHGMYDVTGHPYDDPTAQPTQTENNMTEVPLQQLISSQETTLPSESPISSPVKPTSPATTPRLRASRRSKARHSDHGIVPRASNRLRKPTGKAIEAAETGTMPPVSISQLSPKKIPNDSTTSPQRSLIVKLRVRAPPTSDEHSELYAALDSSEQTLVDMLLDLCGKVTSDDDDDDEEPEALDVVD